MNNIEITLANEIVREECEAFATLILKEEGYDEYGFLRLTKSEDVLDLEDNLSLEEADRLL